MTAAELIEVLKRAPQDLPVCIADFNEGHALDSETAAEMVWLCTEHEHPHITLGFWTRQCDICGEDIDVRNDAYVMLLASRPIHESCYLDKHGEVPKTTSRSV